jgi:acetyl-CoA carboxylase biotin carboxyl carrier protein
MELNEIQSLIKFVSKSGVSEVELETKDVKLCIKTPLASKKDDDKEKTVIHTGYPMGAMPQMPQMPQAMPQQQQAAPQPSAPATDSSKGDNSDDKGSDDKYVTIKSPMIGTFYRSPSPDKPTFVNVGDSISPGQVICIVEAMKLFNEIEAEISGKIVKVLVDDASPVEYDQPLFLVDPS